MIGPKAEKPEKSAPRRDFLVTKQRNKSNIYIYQILLACIYILCITYQFMLLIYYKVVVGLT